MQLVVSRIAARRRWDNDLNWDEMLFSSPMFLFALLPYTLVGFLLDCTVESCWRCCMARRAGANF